MKKILKILIFSLVLIFVCFFTPVGVTYLIMWLTGSEIGEGDIDTEAGNYPGVI